MRRGARAAVLAGCAAAVLLAAAPASAVVFPDLYRLTVTPDPAAGDSRTTAIDLAMRALLTRLTGVRDPGADPGLAALIADAQSYVSFSGMIDGERAQVEFYSNRVEQALESMGRPVWGPERPQTLLWIAIDNGGGERVLLSDGGIGVDGLADSAAVGVSPETAELAEAIREEIKTVADERALPVRFPLLDLEDLASVTSTDIWGAFVDEIEAASARYGADAILIGRISANTFGNNVQWTLVHQGERSVFSGTEVAEGLHWVADRYVQAYSFVGGARTVRIVVRDVASEDDYLRVASYLEGLSALQSVDWVSWDAGQLTFRASARGDIAVLEQMLGLGRVLRLDETRSSSVADNNTLVLTLVSGSRR